MIHPSYVELMDVINHDVEAGEEPVVNSRYSVVCATAKRARQIIDGAPTLIDNAETEKPLSVAVKELYAGELRILTDEEDQAAREAGMAAESKKAAEVKKEVAE